MLIDVIMDVEPPIVIAPVTDPVAVENALPEGWTVGDAWWNGTGRKLSDGRWALPLRRLTAAELATRPKPFKIGRYEPAS